MSIIVSEVCIMAYTSKGFPLNVYLILNSSLGSDLRVQGGIHISSFHECERISFVTF